MTQEPTIEVVGHRGLKQDMACRQHFTVRLVIKVGGLSQQVSDESSDQDLAVVSISCC